MSTTIKNPIDPAAAVAAAPVERKIRYDFPIPESARSRATDPKVITLEELDVENELSAQRLAETKKNPYLHVAFALVEIDGKPVDWGTGERDRRIAEMSPKVRELLGDAFKSLHSNTIEETRSFLKARTVRLM